MAAVRRVLEQDQLDGGLDENPSLLGHPWRDGVCPDLERRLYQESATHQYAHSPKPAMTVHELSQDSHESEYPVFGSYIDIEARILPEASHATNERQTPVRSALALLQLSLIHI